MHKTSRMVSILIDRDLDDELTEFANMTGQEKESIARDAIAEWLEDQKDIRTAQRVIAQNNPKFSMAEVKRILELDD